MIRKQKREACISVRAAFAILAVAILASPIAATAQLLGGLVDTLESIAPVEESTAVPLGDLSSGADELLAPTDTLEDAFDPLDLSEQDAADLLLVDDAAIASGSEGDETSPLPLLTEPAGESLAPLVNTVDTTLDPVTDPIDAALAPIVELVEPVVNPVTSVAEPATFPVEGLVGDLTGGSVEDALTTSSDSNTDNGDGLVNDLLGGQESSSSADNTAEVSPIAPISGAAGESLAPLVTTVDIALDPITNPVDQALAPVVEALEPITQPVLEAIDPVSNPVDGLVADVSGGSVEDALTTTGDSNASNGDGVVNDLLGSGTDEPSTNETSPVEALSAPAGEGLSPLVDALDTGLDPVTDPVDEGVAPLIEALEPVSAPLIDTAQPLSNPVDGLLADTTGGSLEDALTTSGDSNSADGDGLVNDLLGGPEPSSSGETSPSQPLSSPAGDSLAPLIGTLDTSLDPLTDPIDDSLAPLVEALEPATSPILDATSPVIEPVDAVVGDLTGGSVSDALTSTNDGNPDNGDGLINDLLGSGGATGEGSGDAAESSSDGSGSPLGGLGPLVDTVDTTLDPITDPLDAVLAPIVEALEPVTAPVLEGASPIVEPVDDLVGGITGGSVSDALTTTNDGNPDNGDGVFNDLLGSGGNSGEASGDPDDSSGGNGGGLPLVDLGPLVDGADTTLDPITDPLDAVLAPIVEVLEPVTAPVLEGASPIVEPVDDLVGGITGGSLSDALTTTNDGNPDNGDGLINDLLGSDGATGEGSGDAGDGSSNGSGSPLGGLGPLVDTVDTTLDPVTDPLDAVLAPIVEVLEPVTAPVLEGASPIVEPVDDLVGGMTGGSVSDALTSTSDGNPDNGDGVFNDLLGSGGDAGEGSGGNSGEASGDSDDSSGGNGGGLPLVDLGPLVDGADTTLDPITDPLDAVLAPIVEVLEPVTAPVLEGASPIVEPVDDLVGGITGGSLSDALTTTGDSNTDNGDGVFNDLLGSGGDSSGSSGGSGSDDDSTDDSGGDSTNGSGGSTGNSGSGSGNNSGGGATASSGGSDSGGSSDNAGGSEQGAGSPLSPITEPAGEGFNPVIESADNSADPATDPADTMMEPVIEGAAPVTGPVLTVGSPAVSPIDDAVGDIFGGSLEDALSPAGDGVVSDLFGRANAASNTIGDAFLFGLRGKDQPAVDGAAAREEGGGICGDGDGDGICDTDDLCPNSSAGASVMTNGCSLITTASLELEGVQFEVNSAELTASALVVLEEALAFLQASGVRNFIIAGHTDTVGPADYNKELSIRRARAVAQYLIGKGVEPNRLILKGYGEGDPVANETVAETRARNRRAVMIFPTQQAKTLTER